MTEQKPMEHPEVREPEILGPKEMNEGLLQSLVQHLVWEIQGNRDVTATRRYVHYGDASISINNSEMTFEEYRYEPNEGAIADGVMITLTPKNGGFAEMPRTDREESEVDLYIEQLEGELRSCKEANRGMQSQIASLERRLGDGDAEGTA